jgi:hypothetical protein
VLFGAEPTEVTGERREVLERINYLLLSSSDPDVKRAERVLVALMRND